MPRMIFTLFSLIAYHQIKLKAYEALQTRNQAVARIADHTASQQTSLTR